MWLHQERLYESPGTGSNQTENAILICIGGTTKILCPKEILLSRLAGRFRDRYLVDPKQS